MTPDEGALIELVMDPARLMSFGRWLTGRAPEEVAELELVAMGYRMASMSDEQLTSSAYDVCRRYLYTEPPSAEAAMAQVEAAVGKAVSRLASSSLPMFLAEAARAKPLQSAAATASTSGASDAGYVDEAEHAILALCVCQVASIAAPF